MNAFSLKGKIAGEADTMEILLWDGVRRGIVTVQVGDCSFECPVEDFVRGMTPVMLEAFERVGGPFFMPQAKR